MRQFLKEEIASKPQTDGAEEIYMLDDFYDIFESWSAKSFKDLGIMTFNDYCFL